VLSKPVSRAAFLLSKLFAHTLGVLGTMVVVQDGVDFMGSEVKTSVTKILQTAAGRMVFAKPEEEPKKKQVRKRDS